MSAVYKGVAIFLILANILRLIALAFYKEQRRDPSYRLSVAVEAFIALLTIAVLGIGLRGGI